MGSQQIKLARSAGHLPPFLLLSFKYRRRTALTDFASNLEIHKSAKEGNSGACFKDQREAHLANQRLQPSRKDFKRSCSLGPTLVQPNKKMTEGGPNCWYFSSIPGDSNAYEECLWWTVKLKEAGNYKLVILQTILNGTL